MKVLICIPHVFEPKKDSAYSSQNESKREIKIKALREATIGNLERHGEESYIHASLGKGREVITRAIKEKTISLEIWLFTKSTSTLANTLPYHKNLKVIYVDHLQNIDIPKLASKKAIEMSIKFDIVSYMEDDIAIRDLEFFTKVKDINEVIPKEYILLPHRCEKIPGKGFVILSGDPDGGRKDLFWDTGEKLKVKWASKGLNIYRATNPHSGCFFLTKEKARIVHDYWISKKWKCNFELSGPLEQAASGILLPILKIMKTKPEDFKTFMVEHMDEHGGGKFESNE